MQEQARLAYLEAMGVTNWIPRKALIGVPERIPYTLPAVQEAQPTQEPDSAPSAAPVTAPISKAPAVKPAALVNKLRGRTTESAPA